MLGGASVSSDSSSSHRARGHGLLTKRGGAQALPAPVLDRTKELESAKVDRMVTKATAGFTGCKHNEPFRSRVMTSLDVNITNNSEVKLMLE